MCGFAGILRRHERQAADWAVLASMSEAIAHRGPDGHGYFLSGAIGLAHRRLSIIDIAGGQQPMIDTSKGHVLVYNGELYNFLSLRDDLAKKGVHWTTRSDTEVVLRVACTRTFDWVSPLNGMFAFALWSESTRQLVLGRDRLGIKPLFYAATPDEFIFASEIKSLLRHPDVARTVNAARIPEYLAFRSLIGPETMFSGIYQVPAGHVLVVSQDDLSTRQVKFWPVDGVHDAVSTIEGSVEEVRDQVGETLKDSVRRQLISDVPVGTFLSGGVDSSLTTSFARGFHTGELHTFSVGFREAEHDESQFAQQVATALGTTHHALIVSEDDYLAQLENTVRQLDEPLNHAHTVQLQLLSRHAKSFVTVVLTGEGADELFGGYPRLQIPLLAQRLEWLPSVLSAGLREAASLGGLRRVAKLLEASSSFRNAVIHNARFVPLDDVAALGLGDRYSKRENVFDSIPSDVTSRLDHILAFDQQTYLPSLLARLDKASMAAGVECRVPFLDNEVIDLSAQVPARLKMLAGRENKIVLKKLAETMLPKELVYRRKVGFGTPLTTWFRNPAGLGAYLDSLTAPSSRIRSYVDERGLRQLIDEHRSGRRDHAEALWGLLALELWHRSVVEAAPAAASGSSWPRECAALRPVNLNGSEGLHSGITV
jgi:asparagine synthase (glutamine-hydrolysing)